MHTGESVPQDCRRKPTVRLTTRQSPHTSGRSSGKATNSPYEALYVHKLCLMPTKPNSSSKQSNGAQLTVVNLSCLPCLRGQRGKHRDGRLETHSVLRIVRELG